MIAGMGRLQQIGIWLCVALCLAASPFTSAAELDAGQRAARVDALFAELNTTKDEQRGQAATAEIWQHWMKSGRDDIDMLTGQAVGFMAADVLPSARAILDKVVAQAPDYAEGWNKRATVLYMLGEHELSLADIDKVLALEPRHFGAISGIGLIKMAKGDKKGALEAYRRVLVIDPQSPTARQSVESLAKEVEGDPT